MFPLGDLKPVARREEFRQFIDNSGGQQEFYPYNEPATMPIERVILPDGSWLRVEVNLP